jgi:hypothetical protein
MTECDRFIYSPQHHSSILMLPTVRHWLCNVGVLIRLWLFLFAAQTKEFFLDGLKKLEQRSHKFVELRGEYVG